MYVSTKFTEKGMRIKPVILVLCIILVTGLGNDLDRFFRLLEGSESLSSSSSIYSSSSFSSSSSSSSNDESSIVCDNGEYDPINGTCVCYDGWDGTGCDIDIRWQHNCQNHSHLSVFEADSSKFTVKFETLGESMLENNTIVKGGEKYGIWVILNTTLLIPNGTTHFHHLQKQARVVFEIEEGGNYSLYFFSGENCSNLAFAGQYEENCTELPCIKSVTAEIRLPDVIENDGYVYLLLGSNETHNVTPAHNFVNISAQRICNYECVNGDCNTTNYWCECYDGWYDLDCSKKREEICPDECNYPSNGYCDNVQGCECYLGWIGPSCSVNNCPDNCNSNFGNGMCTEEGCLCFKGFDGEACEIKLCHDDCNNRGFCTHSGCDCFQGYNGTAEVITDLVLPDCHIVCEDRCSLLGYCDLSGVCICDENWAATPSCSFPSNTSSFDFDTLDGFQSYFQSVERVISMSSLTGSGFLDEVLQLILFSLKKSNITSLSVAGREFAVAYELFGSIFDTTTSLELPYSNATYGENLTAPVSLFTFSVAAVSNGKNYIEKMDEQGYYGVLLYTVGDYTVQPENSIVPAVSVSVLNITSNLTIPISRLVTNYSQQGMQPQFSFFVQISGVQQENSTQLHYCACYNGTAWYTYTEAGSVLITIGNVDHLKYNCRIEEYCTEHAYFTLVKVPSTSSSSSTPWWGDEETLLSILFSIVFVGIVALICIILGIILIYLFLMMNVQRIRNRRKEKSKSQLDETVREEVALELKPM